MVADPIRAETTVPPDLEVRVQRLIAEWRTERGYSASINKWVQLPAYRQIVELGTDDPSEIIPLLLRELEQTPDHWFWALKDLTGINPVQADSRGNVLKMAADWLCWGRNQGFRW